MSETKRTPAERAADQARHGAQHLTDGITCACLSVPLAQVVATLRDNADEIERAARARGAWNQALYELQMADFAAQRAAVPRQPDPAEVH